MHRRQLTDRTAIVVAGDHGESLGDHGEPGHGIFLYESVMRVPLIVRAPAIRGGRVSSIARLIDIAPTAFDLLGEAVPRSDGVSLLPLMRGTRDRPDLDAYLESLYPERFGLSRLRALRERRYKLIDAPRPELYDLHADPGEQHHLYDRRPSLAAAMTARLRVLGDARDAAAAVTTTLSLAGEARERLAALGYASGSRSIPLIDRSLPDPKDHIAAAFVIGRAVSLEPPRPAFDRIVPLATDAGFQGGPAWSPDGKTIAYKAEVDGVVQIFMRTVGSAMRTQITNSRFDCFTPRRSADGSRIFYHSAAGEDALWQVSAAGGAPQLLIGFHRLPAPNHGGSAPARWPARPLPMPGSASRPMARRFWRGCGKTSPDKAGFRGSGRSRCRAASHARCCDR